MRASGHPCLAAIGVGGDSETRRWAVCYTCDLLKGGCFFSSCTSLISLLFFFLVNPFNFHPYIPHHLSIHALGSRDLVFSNKHRRAPVTGTDPIAQAARLTKSRSDPNAGRLAAMNRHYASPKGYGAYPRGPSTFSISPNRYVRVARASLPHGSLEIIPTVDLQKSTAPLTLILRLDSNLAPQFYDVDASSSNA